MTAVEQAQRIVAGYFSRPDAPKFKRDGTIGAYDPDKDEVIVPTELPAEVSLQYRVLFHEMAHSTGKRLGRSMRIPDNETPAFSRQYAIEEITAEYAAWILLERIGFADDVARSESKHYLQSWLYGLRFNGGGTKDVLTAHKAALVAVDYILGDAEAWARKNQGE